MFKNKTKCVLIDFFDKNKYIKEGCSMGFNNKDKENKKSIDDILENSIEMEEDLMRTYLITAERVHDDDELKERLENFAEGNAKRTKQLIDELNEKKK
jgi:rubrerythrin